ncbi:LysR family transcriptional regulator [Leisingera sp. SS27]|uniref:LysR family transcriptional regulator n=1 Tax=Leisingera sp. SS27 TaxID=2979462 RepID=UPI00232E3912|nr:LysR family transcriptional regulator [Leisingera sp. SS27]MDC0658787.1 LysR family transcriptional regulator [Leisingera sp. SS27]
MQQMNWDDLRFLLAIARAESLAGAADIMGLDATTVSRRIKGLEKRAGAHLINRSQSGLSQLTQTGQHLAEHAEQMEQHVHAAQALLGKDTQLRGTVRLTAVPFLLNRLLAPCLAEYSTRHPGLNISLIPDSQNLSLTRREVDLALRFGEPREGGNAVLAQKMGCVTFSAFTARDALEIAPEDRPWLVYDPVAAHLPQAAWTETLARQTNGPRSQIQVHDLETAFEACLAAPLRAVLPVAAARRESRLIELQPASAMPGMARDVWLLRHSDMRGVDRIEAIITWLLEADLFR